jgi:uncharacterized phiE125 gp8 family phage protein
VPLVLKTAATAEPVTLDEAKRALRITSNEQDQELSAFLSSARSVVEARSNRQLMSASWYLKLDYFPRWEIVIPLAPVSSVTEITYVDLAGDTQTLASTEYLVDALSEPARITPAYDKFWPNVRSQMNAVSIEFVAGYATANLVPPEAKQAIIMLAGHWFENREATTDMRLWEVPLAVDALIDTLSWGSYQTRPFDC